MNMILKRILKSKLKINLYKYFENIFLEYLFKKCLR